MTNASKTRSAPDYGARWWEKMRELNFRCFYCGRRGFPMEHEHRLPVALGGTEEDRNIVPACRPCNRRKGTMTDYQFFRFLEDAVPRGHRIGPRRWCRRCAAPRVSPPSSLTCRCSPSSGPTNL